MEDWPVNFCPQCGRELTPEEKYDKRADCCRIFAVREVHLVWRRMADR